MASCDRFTVPAGGLGYCNAHYQRLRLYGDVMADKPLRKLTKPPAFCTVDGCKRRAKSKGVCGTHYRRLRDSGDVQADLPIGYLNYPAGQEAPDPNPEYLSFSVDQKWACLYDPTRRAFVIFDPRAVTFFTGSRPVAQCRLGVCDSREVALERFLTWKAQAA